MNKIILLLLLVASSACTTMYYAPNSQNVPLADSKGDLRLRVGYGQGTEANVAELQGSYALTNHVGTLVNLSRFWGNYSSTAVSSSSSASMIEGGLGYFNSIGGSSYKFEVYGGYGHAIALRSSYFGSLDYQVRRFFIQPAIAYDKGNVEIALSTRGGHHQFFNLDYSLSNPNEDLSQEYNFTANPNHFMVEPAITLRFGTKYVKLQFQTVLSFNLTDRSFPQEVILTSGMLVIDLFPLR